MLLRRFSAPIEPFPLKTDFVDRKATRAALGESMAYDHCGVHVFWAPPSAGKTTFLRSVIPELMQQGQITGGVYLKGRRTTHTPLTWLYDSLDIVNPGQSVNERLRILLEKSDPRSPHMVIAIDQFDELHSSLHLGELRSLVTSLATSSVGSKAFSVVLGVSRVEIAREILTWNEGQKIYLVGDPAEFKWEESEVVDLAEKLAERNVHNRSTMLSRELIDLCCQAGTPGMVIDAHCFPGDKTLPLKVEVVADAWNRGEELNRLVHR